MEDLFSSGKISRKTYLVLLKARLRTVFDLKRYRSGLPRLFRGGVNSIKEVNNVLDEMDGYDKLPEMSTMLFPPPEPELSRGELLFESLGEDQLELLELVYKRFIERMAKTRERASTRVANVLTTIPIANFIRDYLFEEDERILMLSEMGETSLPYLATLKEELNNVIDDFGNNDIPLQYKILQFHAQGALDNDSFVLQYFETHEQLPVLYLLQKHIIENKSQQTIKAFLGRYDIFDGKVELDTSEIKKSPFTITSYSNSVYDALFTVGTPVDMFGQFLGELMMQDWDKNGLLNLFNDNFVDENDERVARIIEEQHLLMHPTCVVAILGKMLASNYRCLGGYSRSLGSALEGRWKHSYLVSAKLADNVDFERELWLFRDTIVKDSTDCIAFDLYDYVVKRMEAIGYNEQLDEIVHIMKTIFVGELQLDTTEDGNVIIPRMKDKSLADRLYIILDKNKQPMTLDELTDTINSGDGRRYVRASVSLALNRDDRFQGSGKKGLYALSVWELPYFGSNASIVYSVLSEADRPMKSDEIVHILSKCPYNSQFNKNDLSSVFSLGKDMFVKFGQGYYGLAGREYSEETLMVTKNPFDIERDAMMSFMEENGRVPMRDGENGESAMRIWFDRKRKQFEGSNSWKDEKKASFAQLVDRFDQLLEKDDEPKDQNPLPLFPENEDTPSETQFDKDETESLGASQVVIPVVGDDAEVNEKETIDEQEQEFIPSNEDVEEVPVGVKEDQQIVDDVPEEQQLCENLKDDTDDSKWMEMMSKVWEFVKINNREPLAMFTVEVEYAEWLKEQKMALRNDELPDSQRCELLKLRDFLW